MGVVFEGDDVVHEGASGALVELVDEVFVSADDDKADALGWIQFLLGAACEEVEWVFVGGLDEKVRFIQADQDVGVALFEMVAYQAEEFADGEASVGKCGVVVESEFSDDVEEGAFFVAVEVLIVEFG